MKHKFLYSFGACALLLGAAACNNSTGTSSQTSDIGFKRITVEKTYLLTGSAADYEAESDLSYNCTADLLLPTSLEGKDVATLRDAILKTALDSTSTDVKSLIEKKFTDVAGELGFKLSEATGTEEYDGLYNLEGSVVNLGNKVLSYAVNYSSYEPRSAHGMYGTYYINYDLQTGKIITLSDLFTPEGLTSLPQSIRTTATGMQSFIGETNITALPSENNFYIAPDGNIVFVYQPYEVASYAQGEISIPLQPYLLSDSLTPYGTKLLLNID